MWSELELTSGLGAGQRGPKSPASNIQHPDDLGREAAQSAWFSASPFFSPFSALLLSSPSPSLRLQPCNSSPLCVHALCDRVSRQHYFCILMLKQYFTQYMTALGAFAKAFHICYFV